MQKTSQKEAVMNSFHAALLESGYKPPQAIRDDGCFQRFGDNNAQWLVSDGKFGVAGDWRGMLPRVRWSASGSAMLSPHEKIRAWLAAKEAYAAYTSNKYEREIEAAQNALSLWQEGSENIISPYLERKMVPAIGLKYSKDRKTKKPFVMLPMRDVDGRLWSIQKIFADGSKLFLKAGRKHGCFHALGNIAGSDTLYFCEGYATAASVYRAVGKAVIVCFDAGNLEPVIGALRKAHPNKRFVIAGDNDAYGTVNAGKEKAEIAARKHDCRITLPTFVNAASKPTDFNDVPNCKIRLFLKL
jgi:putative DNA primase/helicase